MSQIAVCDGTNFPFSQTSCEIKMNCLVSILRLISFKYFPKVMRDYIKTDEIIHSEGIPSPIQISNVSWHLIFPYSTKKPVECKYQKMHSVAGLIKHQSPSFLHGHFNNINQFSFTGKPSTWSSLHLISDFSVEEVHHTPSCAHSTSDTGQKRWRRRRSKRMNKGEKLKNPIYVSWS